MSDRSVQSVQTVFSFEQNCLRDVIYKWHMEG